MKERERLYLRRRESKNEVAEKREEEEEEDLRRENWWSRGGVGGVGSGKTSREVSQTRFRIDLFQLDGDEYGSKSCELITLEQSQHSILIFSQTLLL